MMHQIIIKNKLTKTIDKKEIKKDSNDKEKVRRAAIRRRR